MSICKDLKEFVDKLDERYRYYLANPEVSKKVFEADPKLSLILNTSIFMLRRMYKELCQE
jgi:hypothetical protein